MRCNCSLPGFALMGLLLMACGDDSGTSGPDPDPEPEAPEWAEAFDAEADGWLLSVWGPDEDDLWAVGGTEEQGAARHFDGDRWRSVQLPDDTALLNWAHGFGPDDVTFVGNEGLVLHYDGHAWTKQDTPTEQDLWGVWGHSPDALWAVGGRGRAAGEATLLYYDGDAWTEAQLPDFERSGVNALFKVWGVDADDVYAVGQRGAVIHYDGDEWSELLVGASDDLIAIWGTDSDNVVAVGGRGLGIISVWDGDDWNTESLAPMAGLNGVWLDDDQVYVVGEGGTAAAVDLDDYAVQQHEADTNLDLHGVFGVGSRLYSVGGNFAGPVPPYRGIALTLER